MSNREKALAWFIAREKGIPMTGAREMYQEAIKALSEPIRPKGRWIGGEICSNCGISKYNFISFNYSDDDKEAYVRPFGQWNSCPKCKAEMEVEHE